MNIDNKITEEINNCLNCKKPNCVEHCPLGVNIPKMIELAKQEKYEEAFFVDFESNPLGAICGIICPHEKRCQGNCIKGIKGQSVKIGDIESSICQNAIYNIPDIKNKIEEFNANHPKVNSNIKVAIIGGRSCRHSICSCTFKIWYYFNYI